MYRVRGHPLLEWRDGARLPHPKPNPNPNPDQADHAHDDMAQDMEGGGAAATSFVQYVTYVGPNGDLFVSGSVRATP